MSLAVTLIPTDGTIKSEIHVEMGDPSSIHELFHIIIKDKAIAPYLEHLDNPIIATTAHLIDSKNPFYCSHGNINILEQCFTKIETILGDPSIWTMKIVYPPLSLKPYKGIEVIKGKTPLIFLDVDGVINVPDPDNKALKLVNIMGGFGDATFDIRYHPKIVKAVNDLSDLAEIRWLTSWHHKAKYRLGPTLGFKNFDVHHHSKYSLRYPEGMNEEDLERPVVWIDDELEDTYGMMDHFNYVKGIMKNKLMGIAPEQKEGLTMGHIKKIREFLTSLHP
jgi:hypothetical protein